MRADQPEFAFRICGAQLRPDLTGEPEGGIKVWGVAVISDESDVTSGRDIGRPVAFANCPGDTGDAGLRDGLTQPCGFCGRVRQDGVGLPGGRAFFKAGSSAERVEFGAFFGLACPAMRRWCRSATL